MMIGIQGFSVLLLVELLGKAEFDRAMDVDLSRGQKKLATAPGGDQQCQESSTRTLPKEGAGRQRPPNNERGGQELDNLINNPQEFQCTKKRARTKVPEDGQCNKRSSTPLPWQVTPARVATTRKPMTMSRSTETSLSVFRSPRAGRRVGVSRAAWNLRRESVKREAPLPHPRHLRPARVATTRRPEMMSRSTAT